MSGERRSVPGETQQTAGAEQGRFTGVGFLVGVPARDLTAMETMLYRGLIEAGNAASVLPLYRFEAADNKEDGE